MNKGFVNALKISGTEKLLRELNLRFQSSRMDLVRFHRYLMVCSQTTNGNDDLASKYRSVALKMNSALEKMSVMGRRWEDVLGAFQDVEDSLGDLESYFLTSLTDADRKFHMQTLRNMNEKFGVSFVSKRLFSKIKDGHHTIEYLHMVIAQIIKHNPEEHMELTDALTKIKRVSAHIKGKDVDGITLQDTIIYIRVIRQINDMTTMLK